MSIEKKSFKRTVVNEGEETVVVICELCRVRFKEADDGYNHEIRWTDDPGLVIATSIYNQYHIIDRDSGGQDDRKHLDICPKCFDTKLIPWFEEQGGKVRIEELTH